MTSTYVCETTIGIDALVLKAGPTLGQLHPLHRLRTVDTLLRDVDTKLSACSGGLMT
jgi:hypothetical protein